MHLKPTEVHLPDDTELEIIVSPALDNRRVAHLHSGRVCPRKVLLLLNGLLYGLCQLAVPYFLPRDEEDSTVNTASRMRGGCYGAGEIRLPCVGSDLWRCDSKPP